MKKAVVFGGSGFLGSHVADALNEAGWKVRIFDQKESPFRQDGQEMVVGDLMDPGAVEKAASGCDAVYNFAAIADIDETKLKPVDTLRFNVIGNAHVLEAARKAKAKRFVLASSVYVYSRSGSFYRVSKQACEQFTEVFGEETGLEYTIVRYGSLYGRRADMRNGIFRLLHGALTDGKIRYHGNGEELREYIHVEDAARLSVQVLGKEFANEPVILTGHHPMRVRDVMEMVREIMGGKVKLELAKKPLSGHYKITPYAYHPRIARKFVGVDYTDMGQGLLDCLAEIDERIKSSRSHEPRRRP